MTELVKYEAACRAVADAASIDEAKDFRDQSEAMRAYARQAKNKQMEAQAAEIRFRAERRIGELMAAQRDGVGLSAGGRPSDKTGSRTNPVSAAPALAEIGIDKKLADRARKYAAIPEQEFNGIVSDWRTRVEAENERVTVNLLSAGSKAQQKREPDIEPVELEPVADPRGYRGLTHEALVDLANGLHEQLDAEKARRKKAEAEAEHFKALLKELGEGDNNARKAAMLDRQLTTSKGRLGEELAKNARQGRRIKILEAELAEANRKLESQEFTL